VIAATTDGAYLTIGTDVNTENGKLYGASADTIDVLFTSSNGDTSVLTQGKIRVIVSFDDIAQV
jgi:hypothetical protein